MWPSGSFSLIILFLTPSILATELTKLPPKIPIPVEAGHYNNATRSLEGVERSLLGLFSKRQNDCTSGCRYCCEDGVCAGSEQDNCCGGYYCDAPRTCGWYRGCCAAGTKACHDGCIPNDAECCQTDRYCDEGTYCYRVNGSPACCNEDGEDCEYYSWPDSEDVTESSTSTYDYTTTFTTETQIGYTTGTQWEYYTQTITWTYWVTYYTYHISISTSLLTSTATTTTTIVSVSATDTAAASSSFAELSATLTFTPPASATNPPTPDSTPTSTSISGEPGSGSGNDSPSLGDDTASEQNGNGSQSQFSAPWGHLLLLSMSLMPCLAAVLL